MKASFPIAAILTLLCLHPDHVMLGQPDNDKLQRFLMGRPDWDTDGNQLPIISLAERQVLERCLGEKFDAIYRIARLKAATPGDDKYTLFFPSARVFAQFVEAMKEAWKTDRLELVTL
jgi:hypothetical protein